MNQLPEQITTLNKEELLVLLSRYTPLIFCPPDKREIEQAKGVVMRRKANRHFQRFQAAADEAVELLATEDFTLYHQDKIFKARNRRDLEWAAYERCEHKADLLEFGEHDAQN